MRISILLACAVSLSAAVPIPDIAPRKPVQPQISALAWSPDGKLLALGTFGEVRLVNPATGTVVDTWKGHTEQVRAVAFSRDGKRLAAGEGLPAQRGEVRVWDVEQRKEILTFKAHSDCVYGLAFAPDGKSIATSSYDKLIYLWDAATGQQVRKLKDHIDAVYALAFTPDGKRLVSAAADRSVKIWNPETGERLYTFSDATDGLNTVAVDPSGRFVAAGGYDKTIRIWSLGATSGKLEQTLIAHEDAILQLAFSGDGKTLLSSAADRTLKSFSVDPLAETHTYAVQPDWSAALAFAPDGKHFAVGRFDGSFAILEVNATPSKNRAD